MPKKVSKQDTRIDKTGDFIIGENRKKKTTKKKVKKEVKKEARHRIIASLIKWMILIALLAGAIIFLLSTPLFNITNITVSNNSKLSSDTIEELAGIQVGENIFRLSKKQIEQNIKQNPYVDSVEVKRNLPSQLEISIKERQATYLIEVGNGYMAINNQGYLLELQPEADGMTTITGFKTRVDNIEEGQRLEQEDLNQLEIVLKIMDSINVKGITEKVTDINVINKQNYTLTMQEEGKTIYLGDASDISTRILYLKAILAQTKDRTGEIFIDGDTSSSNPYFREKI